MPEGIGITIENKLREEKRSLNVYHHSTRSAHIISHNSSVALPLKKAEAEDYLHISVVRGPGNFWKDCLADLPLWVDFEFSSEGKITLTHSGDRLQLKILAGPATWQLKITRPTDSPAASSSSNNDDKIIIGYYENSR
jgi:hypothetical protein